MFGSTSLDQGHSADTGSPSHSISLTLATAVLAVLPCSLSESASAQEKDIVPAVATESIFAAGTVQANFFCVDNSGEKATLYRSSGTICKVSSEGYFYLDSDGKEGFIPAADLLRLEISTRPSVLVEKNIASTPQYTDKVTVGLSDGTRLLVDSVTFEDNQVTISDNSHELSTNTRALQYIRFSTGNQFDDRWNELVAKQDSRVTQVVLRRDSVLDYLSAGVLSLGKEQLTLLIDDQKYTPKWAGKIEGIVFQPPVEKQAEGQQKLPELTCVVKGQFGEIAAHAIDLKPDGTVAITSRAGLTVNLPLTELAELDFLPARARPLTALSHRVMVWKPLDAVTDEQAALDSMLTGSVHAVNTDIVSCNSTASSQTLTIAEGVSCDFYTRASFSKLIGSFSVSDTVECGSSILKISDGNTVLYEQKINVVPGHVPDTDGKTFFEKSISSLLGTIEKPSAQLPERPGLIELDIPIENVLKLTISVHGTVPITFLNPQVLE